MALAGPEYIQELFSAFGRVAVRRMFGGAGVFADGLMFALIADDEIFLKADDETIPAFRGEGMQPFTYGAKSRRIVMSYWRLPDRLLDDPEELAQWARAALAAARRKNAKPKRSKTVAARKRKPNGRGALRA